LLRGHAIFSLSYVALTFLFSLPLR